MPKSYYKLIFYYLSIFIMMIGLIQLIPLLTIPFYPEEFKYAYCFLIPGILSVLFGCYILLKYRNLKVYNCSFILVHHTNKDTKKGQIFDNINGSVGIQGSAEHLMILDQDDEFSKDFQLHLMGRYILRQDINLQKDKNGCFEIQTTDKTLNCDNPDILTLINYVAKQEDKTITGTSNEICSNANLKTISANWLYKKLVEYQEFLKQCSITFEKRKSNGIRLIEIKCNDRELS